MITEVLTTINRKSVTSHSEARCSQVHPPDDLLQLLEENSAACQIIVTQGVSNAGRKQASLPSFHMQGEIISLVPLQPPRLMARRVLGLFFLSPSRYHVRRHMEQQNMELKPSSQAR